MGGSEARYAAGVLLAVTVAVGCSGTPTVAPGIALGTRLEARFQEAEGGARVFDHWYDRQLGVRCAFFLATDGRHRCLPSSENVEGSIFSDPSCGSPAALAGACGTPSSYVLTAGGPAPTCPDTITSAVYALGAARAGTT